MTSIFDIILRCKIDESEYKSDSEAKEHFKEHIRKGDVFSAPCRLNGYPCNGVCVDETMYKHCMSEPRMKNNWMCWRDGILVDLGREAAQAKVVE